MSSATLSSVFGGLTDALVGGILGFFIAYFSIRISRKRKIIQYKVSSMPLLKFKPTTEFALTVSVDKFALTGKIEDKGEQVQIKDAYGFQVNLQNRGNEDVEKPIVEITLDDSAKIVGYETQPVYSSAYNIQFERDSSKPNVLRVTAPYINHREKLTVRLISTGNSDRKCEVKALGLGIETTTYLRRLLVPFLILDLLGICIFVASLVLTYNFPDWFVNFIGGTIETKPFRQAVFPTWLVIGVLIVFMAPIIATVLYLPVPKSNELSEWDTDSSNEKVRNLSKRLFK